MNLGDFENYIEKNYQISLAKILSEIDGYTLTGEISHFFDTIPTPLKIYPETLQMCSICF